MIFCKRQEKFASPTLKLVGEAMIKKEERQEEEEKHNPAPTQTPPPGPGPHPPPPSYTSLHSILLQSTTNSSSSTSTAWPDACRQLGDVRRLSDVGNYRSFLGCPSSQVPKFPSAQVPMCPVATAEKFTMPIAQFDLCIFVSYQYLLCNIDVFLLCFIFQKVQ